MIINSANGAIVAGKVTRDAEFKLAGDKKSALAKFSIVGKDGTQEKSAVFVNVIAWFELGYYAKSIKKGNRVLVAGEVQNADYTNKDGELVKRNELRADFIQIQCSSKQQTSNTDGDNASFTVDEPPDGDDLPF